MPNLKNMLSSIFGKETESPFTLQGGVEFNQDINKLPKLAWNGEGKPVYLDENGIELPVNKDPLKQAMNNAYLFGDNVKKWLWEDGRLTDDERETKLNIMTGLITAPVGGEAVLGTKAGLGAIKALTPFVGNKIAQGIVASGASGAIGGGAEGLMRGVFSDNENPLQTALSDAATGAVSGLALGYGFGKLGKAFARKALKGADSAKIKSYFDDYVDGLYQSDKVGGLDLKAKAMADMRAVRNGEKIVGNGSLFDYIKDEKGEPVHLLHGTSNIFDKFNKNMLGSLTGSNSAKKGFWFTNGKNTAKSYAEYSADNSGINQLIKQQNLAEKTGNWNEYDRLTEEIERLALNSEKPDPRIIDAFLDMNNPVTMDAQGKRFMEVQDKINAFLVNNPNADGFIIKNLDDVVDDKYRESVNHYMVREPEQIKIQKIYDTNGNILFDKLINQNELKRTPDDWLQLANDLKTGKNNPLKYMGSSVKIGNISPKQKEYIFKEVDTNISDFEKEKGQLARLLHNYDENADYLYFVLYNKDGNHTIQRSIKINDNFYDKP